MTNKDRFKDYTKHPMTYFHWYTASKELKWRYSQQDDNMGEWSFCL